SASVSPGSDPGSHRSGVSRASAHATGARASTGPPRSSPAACAAGSGAVIMEVIGPGPPRSGGPIAAPGAPPPGAALRSGVRYVTRYRLHLCAGLHTDPSTDVPSISPVL